MESNRRVIAMVDDSMVVLTRGRKILSTKFDVITVSGGRELMNLLNVITPDLILLDVEMPEMNGYEVISRLKEDREKAKIPVIFLTSLSDHKSELRGLSMGAVDYITKPFSSALLLKRVELHLLIEEQRKALESYNNSLQKKVEEKSRALTKLQSSVIKTIAELVECRDDVTGRHIERTQKYLKVLVCAMSEMEEYKQDVTSWDLDLLYLSVQLHDVGKIAIKDSILQKPGKLTFEEFEEMKTHTTFGVDVIKRIEEGNDGSSFLMYAEVFAGSHHERWDGTGYPNGLSGEDIPLQGRIMAIVDVYDALTNERPYKRAFSHEEAVDIITQSRGSHFDPKLTDIFLAHEQEFLDILIGTNQMSKEEISGAV